MGIFLDMPLSLSNTGVESALDCFGDYGVK
jgi:hypothetical protein